MRLGGNALRGSNPRSSAVTSSFARALRLGGLLVSAFRGLCVATAAIRPPVYLIATRAAAGLSHARNPGRLAPITDRPAVMFADGSPRVRRSVRSAKAERQGRRDKGLAPAADLGVRACWQLPDVLAEHRAWVEPLATGPSAASSQESP